MSVRAMAQIWDKDLKQNYKLVLLALADWADDDGGRIFPSIRRIAYKTGYSERSIKRILKIFRDNEWLAENGWTKYRTRQYRILFHNIPDLAPYEYGGDKLSPSDDLGVTNGASGGDKLAPGGDKLSPQSAMGDTLTIREPSVEPLVKPLVQKEVFSEEELIKELIDKKEAARLDSKAAAKRNFYKKQIDIELAEVMQRLE